MVTHLFPALVDDEVLAIWKVRVAETSNLLQQADKECLAGNLHLLHGVVDVIDFQAVHDGVDDCAAALENTSTRPSRAGVVALSKDAISIEDARALAPPRKTLTPPTADGWGPEGSVFGDLAAFAY